MLPDSTGRPSSIGGTFVKTRLNKCQHWNSDPLVWPDLDETSATIINPPLGLVIRGINGRPHRGNPGLVRGGVRTGVPDLQSTLFISLATISPHRMKHLKSILALGAFFVLAAGLSACGSGLAGNSVADMAGNSITTSAFNHWMFVAAKGNASQSPGQPVIVPNDPPDFKKCIAQVRKQIPTLAKTTDKQLKSDCNQLFTSLGNQVMDFLIKSYWYQAEAHRLGIKITDAQIQQRVQHRQEAAVPDRRGVQPVPHPVRSDDGRHPLPGAR